MIIAVACDHGGFPIKDRIMRTVREAGHEVLDLGTDSCASTD